MNSNTLPQRAFPIRVSAHLLMMIILLAAANIAGATVVPSSSAIFTPRSFAINFDEVPLGTKNPVYFPPASEPASATIGFDGYFLGQSLGTAGDCGGTAGCLVGSPLAGLSLDAASPDVFTLNDQAAMNNPVLSGSPQFSGPISVAFGRNEAAVALSAGSAKTLGAERLTAFDRDGNILASVTNDALGYSLLALASDDGTNPIAGVQLTRTGVDASGFAAASLIFGDATQIAEQTGGHGGPTPTPSVPEPGNLWLLLLMTTLLGISGRIRRS